MNSKKTVRDIDVAGKKVLVRVDFNVPIDERTGAITDDSRIKATLPTINYLIQNQARIILCSHLGRPHGQPAKSLSLALVADRLSKILRQPVYFAPDCIGPDVELMVNHLNPGEIILLENLRFHIEEEKNDPVFAQALARLADVYVNDAFGTSHRFHASIVGIARYLPSVAGLLLEKEITTLGKLLENPSRPFNVLLGGAKVSDKVRLIENILDKVNSIMIGGGMAATFLKAQGYEVGRSLLEDSVDVASRIMNETKENGVSIILPEDVLVAREINGNAEAEMVPVTKMPPDKQIVDIGFLTISLFTRELEKSSTVFWNGPMGIYEVPAFSEGTKAIAKAISELNAVTIVGGGSTAEILTELKLVDKMTFVSTGGGAALDFLSGGKLPGIEVLEDKVSAEKLGSRLHD